MTIIPLIHAMFATGYDEANRGVFMAADAGESGSGRAGDPWRKRAVDKVIKGLSLHG